MTGSKVDDHTIRVDYNLEEMFGDSKKPLKIQIRKLLSLQNKKTKPTRISGGFLYKI
jgi:hypothetical protein